MSYFERYKKRASINGTDVREVAFNESKENKERMFHTMLGYQQAVLNFEEPFDVVIESAKNHLQKYAFLRPSKRLRNGDYLTFNEQTWIVRSTDYTNVTPRSELFLCNQEFSFKNPKVSFPCHVDTTTYGVKGLVGTGKFQESDSKIKIYIQRNEITERLRLGYRFIFSNRYVYKITGIEDVTYPNIFTVTCECEESVEMDDFKNNIAYNREDSVLKIESDIEIIGEDKVRKGATITYRVEAVENGEWYIDDNSLATIVQINKNEITITANQVSGWLELKFVYRNPESPFEVVEQIKNIMIY